MGKLLSYSGTTTKIRAIKSRLLTRKDYEKFDYLIGMDDGNIRGMRRIAGGDPDGKIYKLLEFSGSGRNIADPWYTGNFDATWADVTEGLEGLKQKLL